MRRKTLPSSVSDLIVSSLNVSMREEEDLVGTFLLIRTLCVPSWFL